MGASPATEEFTASQITNWEVAQNANPEAQDTEVDNQIAGNDASTKPSEMKYDKKKDSRMTSINDSNVLEKLNGRFVATRTRSRAKAKEL